MQQGTSVSRPQREIPKTDVQIDASKINADVAHEESLKYFLENSELGVLNQEQMGLISLIDSMEEIGIDLPGVKQFFEKQRRLSSGEDGKARVQCKEIITAGSFPMSLLFGEQKPSWVQSLASMLTGKKPEQPQQSMR